MEVQRPDSRALGAREADRVVPVLLEASCPVGQRLLVVGGEPLDVLGHEAGPFEGEQDSRELQGGAVREHVALGEDLVAGVVVVEAGDPVVEQPASGSQ